MLLTCQHSWLHLAGRKWTTLLHGCVYRNTYNVDLSHCMRQTQADNGETTWARLSVEWQDMLGYHTTGAPMRSAKQCIVMQRNAIQCCAPARSFKASVCNVSLDVEISEDGIMTGTPQTLVS